MLSTTFDYKSVIDSGAKIWLTADYHFGHPNILKYVNRPWKSIEAHDKDLINNTREVVSEKDFLIINGDLTMFGPEKRLPIEKTLRKLPGQKILVLGNHDKFKPFTYVDMGFIMVTTSLVLDGGILVVHDPAIAAVWPKNKPVICGHVHGLFRAVGNVVNVGVDAWDFAPVELETALALCKYGEETVNWEKVSKERHDSPTSIMSQWDMAPDATKVMRKIRNEK